MPTAGALVGDGGATVPGDGAGGTANPPPTTCCVGDTTGLGLFGRCSMDVVCALPTNGSGVRAACVGSIGGDESGAA